MNRLRSDDAELVYQSAGDGPPVLLLHPFPVHHEFWKPTMEALSGRYRLILPDLRGHGDSEVGSGPATMEKHARDLARILDDIQIPRVVFVGVSIGGYAFFEFWRRFRERVTAVVLCNTKAQADTADARAGRLRAAEEVMQKGTGPFIESMVPKLLGKSTIDSRPDLVDGALRMMRKMSPEGVAQVQRGMANRPDSVSELKSINVPTLLITGDEDLSTGPPEAELMHQNISGSEIRVVPRAGHYAAWEQPETVGALLRQFLDRVSH
ncbi:MAG: alpha/beta hydrolase [Acidobacteria bacterium]|jgi:3-oxoadipate enol-lactonase|nr:MAG: alpha/beta hydrolase [Acidobacteriota bacterium]PYV91988.1 MAG: alpha/beta hydrolase [Acidobacteriota bacterium]